MNPALNKPVSHKTNSVVFVNWEDPIFEEKVTYTLVRQGFVRKENYSNMGVNTQIWERPKRATDQPVA